MALGRISLPNAVKAGTAQAGRFVSSRPDWMLERLSRLNTTNFRVLVTLYLAVRTGEHYFTHPGWEPSIEWMGFVLGLATADVLQWSRKRTTDHEYQRIQRGAAATEREA